MSNRATFCRCKGTYTIDKCDCEKEPYYWSQGIGTLIGQSNSTVVNEEQ